MKKKIQLLTILLFFSILAKGQSCFEKLSDASGMNHSSSYDEIDAVSCAIKNLMPSNLQSSFKVFDASFYVHLESFNDFGFPEAFESTKGDVTTPYYVLVASQNESKGLYTKFWVDVKLPDITSNGCISNLNEQAATYLEFIIEQKFNKSGRSPSEYPDALIEGLTSLKLFLETAIACCNTGGNVEQCMQCSIPDNIVAKLLSLGFNKTSINNIGEHPNPIQNSLISDYADLLFTINDRSAINIPENYADQISALESEGLSVKVIITKDENVCDANLWTSILAEVESERYDIVYWHHIHKGKPNLGDELLLSNIYLKGQTNLRGPDPVSYLIQGSVSALTDVLMQTTMIYLFDENVNSVEDAFYKIDKTDVAISFFTGGLIVKKKTVVVGVIAGTATARFLRNYYNGNYDTWQKAAKGFAGEFLRATLENAAAYGAGYLFQNSGGLSYLQKNGVKKLLDLIPGKSGIKYIWSLSDDLLADYSANKLITNAVRGTVFEGKIVSKYLKPLGFEDLNAIIPNFKIFDAYNPITKIPISIKTTTITDLNSLKSHFYKGGAFKTDEILTAFLSPNKIFEYTKGGISKKIFVGNKSKILIAVPKENLTTCNGFLNQLLDTSTQGVKLKDFLEIEFKTMEDMLNL